MQIYGVLGSIHFSTKNTLILLISAWFGTESAFFGKNTTLTQRNSIRAVLEIL